MIRAPTHDRNLDPALTLGLAAILHAACSGSDLAIVWEGLVKRLDRNPGDAASLMDLSMVLQAAGHAEHAQTVQAAALNLRRCYHRPYGSADGPKVLAILAPGDFMANTPIDFLLQGTNLDLWLTYVDVEGRLAETPDHDVAFLAISESACNNALLERLRPTLAAWPLPLVNGAPEVIARLTRDGAHAILAGAPGLLHPVTMRVSRGSLLACGSYGRGLDSLLPEGRLPILIRPVDTHAGNGLERLESASDLAAYLGRHADETFYLSPFVEYASADGLYRKQRIAFIDGHAYPVHLATSEHWMVHYLSAGMSGHPRRRLEEAGWMASFDDSFARRHAAAFEALHQRLGLDYFGIDCAEAPDGRLLLFEVDVAMAVHDLDPASTFPYKKPVIRRLFDAFCRMLQDRAAR